MGDWGIINSFIPKSLNSSIFDLKGPPSMEERAKDHTQDGQCHPDQNIDHIMVSQVEGGENQSTDDGQKEIEEQLFVAMGQV
jgi:hypothetical protein